MWKEAQLARKSPVNLNVKSHLSLSSHVSHSRQSVLQSLVGNYHVGVALLASVEIITCWNIVAQNWGTTFHFDCVPSAFVELKYYFANCVFSPRLCWDSKAALSI